MPNPVFSHTLKLPRVDGRSAGYDAQTSARVEIEIRPAQLHANSLTVGLDPAPADALELSMCASIYERGRNSAGGQCLDTVRELYPDRADVRELVEIWERWHLNCMKAGTREQQAILDRAREQFTEAQRRDHYAWACDVLRQSGKLIDRGYTYGHAWLFDPLPADVVARIKELTVGRAAA